MKYQLNFRNNNGSDQELLDDLKRAAEKLCKDSLVAKEYDDIEKFSSSTMARRFGYWNDALEKAGLKVTFNPNILEKELFETLEDVWIKLGRQPNKREMQQPLSKYSEKGYVTKFGLWRKSLETFVEFVNSVSDEKEDVFAGYNNIDPPNEPEALCKHKTKRFPSER